MSMCRVFSCVVGRGCLLWPVSSFWQNSVRLWSATLCTPRPNLCVTPDISWLPTFALQSPIMKKTSFLGVSSRRSCRPSRTVQLLHYFWLGHRCGLSWYWMVSLGKWTEIILSFLRLYPSIAFWTLVDYDGYSISSKGFLPTVVDITIIWVKLTHCSPF